jgi:hypothetical protein
VLKLRNAMREYENDRWRIISTKVGSGFSPAACKEKAAEFAAPAAGELSMAPGDLSMTSVDLSGVGSRPPTAEDDDAGSNNDFKLQPESASTDAPPPPYA